MIKATLTLRNSLCVCMCVCVCVCVCVPRVRVMFKTCALEKKKNFTDGFKKATTRLPVPKLWTFCVCVCKQWWLL